MLFFFRTQTFIFWIKKTPEAIPVAQGLLLETIRDLMLDVCLMVRGSWLKAYDSWPRGARGPVQVWALGIGPTYKPCAPWLCATSHKPWATNHQAYIMLQAYKKTQRKNDLFLFVGHWTQRSDDSLLVGISDKEVYHNAHFDNEFFFKYCTCN